MAHFIGSVQGSQGAVTRLGGIKSGITASVRGWREGVRVTLSDRDGETWVNLTRDGGSAGTRPEQLIYHGPLSGLKPQESGS